MKLSLLLLSLCHLTVAQTIETNSIKMSNAPSWLTDSRVRAITDQISDKLEWDIRRINVFWYTDPKAFQKAHGLGPAVRAATLRKDQSVHMGPAVNTKNFEEVFGHELAHVIVAQKYKKAIPLWIEEGLANYVSRDSYIDYKSLSRQKLKPVRSLTHPFMAKGNAKLHYQTSTAAMKMISEKCSVSDLLQLSVGKNLDTYLATYCEIRDLDGALRDWLKVNAKGEVQKPATKTPPKSGGAKKHWWENQQSKKHWWER